VQELPVNSKERVSHNSFVHGGELYGQRDELPRLALIASRVVRKSLRSSICDRQ